jgi:hypothetical protein
MSTLHILPRWKDINDVEDPSFTTPKKNTTPLKKDSEAPKATVILSTPIDALYRENAH